MYTNIIDAALNVIRESAITSDMTANDSNKVKQYCQLELAQLEHEVFSVLYLDSQYRLIEFNKMFRGTIDACTVYSRDIIKKALDVNAKAIILSHNHPSGTLKPSTADINITKRVQECCDLFDIRLLDHVIVTKLSTFSFSENLLL